MKLKRRINKTVCLIRAKIFLACGWVLVSLMPDDSPKAKAQMLRIIRFEANHVRDWYHLREVAWP